MIPNPEYGGDVYAYDFAAIGFELWVRTDCAVDSCIREPPCPCSYVTDVADSLSALRACVCVCVCVCVCLTCVFWLVGSKQTVNNGTIFDNILVTDDIGKD